MSQRMDEPREWAEIAFQWTLAIGAAVMWLTIAGGLALLALGIAGVPVGDLL